MISISILVLVVVCVANPSWAMGKRGGSGTGKFGSSGSSSQGSQQNPSGGDSVVGLVDEGQDDTEDPKNDEQPPSFYSETSGDEQFPASTTVPEPTTLSLMGMGLASFLLKRKKNS